MMMAENSKGEFSGKSPHGSETNDIDFQVSAEMMVDDVDDERTMEEEEIFEEGEDISNEVNDLQKEGEMPIEDLLALYGYNDEGETSELPLEILPETIPLEDEGQTSKEVLQQEEDGRSESSESNYSKSSTGRSSVTHDDNNYDPFQNQRITRGLAALNAHYFEDDSSDEDYQPVGDDWKKEIQIGDNYQAEVPQYMCHYKENEPVFEKDDKLLWKPGVVDNKTLKRFMSIVFRPSEKEVGNGDRDDEQALWMLLQCGSVEECLKRKDEQVKKVTDVNLWLEEECRNFEVGLRIFGKNFRAIQKNKVQSRTVGEIVQFYYLWKKTERYDTFITQSRLGKKKYGLPGVADYMDRFLDENESVVSSRAASPYTNMNAPSPSASETVEQAINSLAQVQSETNGETTESRLINQREEGREIPEGENTGKRQASIAETEESSSKIPRIEILDVDQITNSRTPFTTASSFTASSSFTRTTKLIPSSTQPVTSHLGQPVELSTTTC